MEDFNLNKKHEDILDYIESQFIIHMLTGQEIKKKTSKINEQTLFVRYDFSRDTVVQCIKLFFKNSEESKDSLHISIGNFVWNGHAMRRELLQNGIKQYKKSAHQYGHHYKFDLIDVDQMEKIFTIFKKYLPN
ncbi:hypothetical protein D3C87_78520 [compost metagenome]